MKVRKYWGSMSCLGGKLIQCAVCIALCLGCLSVTVAQTIVTHKLEGIAVGQDNAPRPATVIEISCEAMIESQRVVRTDRRGVFLLSKETHDNPRYFGQGLFAGVFSAGQKSIPLGSGDVGDRSIKLQLLPDEPIGVQVLDDSGHPITGARVLNGSGFSSFCRFDMLAQKLLESELDSLVCLTDSEGHAILRGTTRGDLQSLAVGTPDGRWTQFLIPLSVTKDDTIMLRIPNVRHQLLVQVKGDSGEAVPDAVVWLRTPGDAINKNTLTTAVPMEFRCGMSDQNGQATFADLSVSEVEVWVFFAKDDGRQLIQRGVELVPDANNKLDVSLPTTYELSFSVLDGDRSTPIPNIHFSLAKGAIGVDAKSNEDGIVVVRLPPGKWNCTLDNVRLPDGYVSATSAEREIEVVDGNVETIPPWVLKRGQIFTAEVRGIDLRQILSSYVNVVTKSPMEWKSGKITSDNRIRFTMPSDFSLENIDSIYATDGTEFKIASQEPFVLDAVSKQPEEQ